MKGEAKPALVPKLRFPEFSGAEGWESKFIGPYLEDCSGRVPPDTEFPVYSSTREGLKRQDAYFDGRVLQNKNEYGVVPPGCLVYRHMSDDGLFKFNINETGGDIAVSKEYPVFSTKDLNSVFLLAKLNDGIDFKHFALSQKAGGTRTRLYFSRLCEWRTLLPSLAEQQRIADCLTSLDELIAAQGHKLDALKNHKSGLMQQLFPREGETIPSLRFPEFQDAGEWENEQLKMCLSSISNGLTLEQSRGSVGYKVTRIETISAGTIDLTKVGLVQTSNDISEYKLKVGDILFSNINSLAHIGKSVFVDCENDIYHGMNLLRLKVDSIRHAAKFIFYAINTDATRASLRERSNKAVNQASINQTEVGKTVVFLPRILEQQRIANCLSSLDELIAAQCLKLDALKTHKKGLMQQLFPTTEDSQE